MFVPVEMQFRINNSLGVVARPGQPSILGRGHVGLVHFVHFTAEKSQCKEQHDVQIGVIRRSNKKLHKQNFPP